MRPNERRAAILDALCIRRQDTIANLAEEFGVNEKTIRRDIEELLHLRKDTLKVESDSPRIIQLKRPTMEVNNAESKKQED